jgi:hypothetical protein
MRQRAYDYGSIKDENMEDAKGGSACFYGLTISPFFSLYNY